MYLEGIIAYDLGPFINLVTAWLLICLNALVIKRMFSNDKPKSTKR
jgi:hypothetical protein